MPQINSTIWVTGVSSDQPRSDAAKTFQRAKSKLAVEGGSSAPVTAARKHVATCEAILQTVVGRDEDAREAIDHLDGAVVALIHRHAPG
jgi:hypothetical protein